MGYFAHHSYVSIHPLNYQDRHWLTAEFCLRYYPQLKGAAFSKVVGGGGLQSPDLLPQLGTVLIILSAPELSVGLADVSVATLPSAWCSFPTSLYSLFLRVFPSRFPADLLVSFFPGDLSCNVPIHPSGLGSHFTAPSLMYLKLYIH